MASVHEQLRSCSSYFYSCWGMDYQNPMEKPSLAGDCMRCLLTLRSLAKTAHTFAHGEWSE